MTGQIKKYLDMANKVMHKKPSDLDRIRTLECFLELKRFLNRFQIVNGVDLMSDWSDNGKTWDRRLIFRYCQGYEFGSSRVVQGLYT
jgi:hypothetical protein